MSKTIEILQNHGTILCPTDTILGLSCNAFDIKAIKKIQEIKNRSKHKSFILLVPNQRELQNIVEVPEMAWDIMDLSPKPVTIIYDNPKKIPQELIAGDNTIAIRLVKNDFLQKLMYKIKAPLISTSANISGEKTPIILDDVSETVKQKVDYIVPQAFNFKPKHHSSSIIKLSIDGLVKIIRE